jgi:hypothetical protein
MDKHDKGLWEKTKDVSAEAWDKTKEMSAKAWDKTKDAFRDDEDNDDKSNMDSHSKNKKEGCSFSRYGSKW